MNLVHKKYDYLFLSDINNLKNEDKYKYYVGRGNNSMLISSLMKRRFWWVQEDDYKKANFSWTQLKINFIYQQQKKSEQYVLETKIEKADDEKKRKNTRKKTEPKSPSKNNVFFKPPFPSEKDKLLTKADKRILSIL
jgi:hypothetical protein